MIPRNITRAHIMGAIEYIAEHGVPKQRDSTKFDLVIDGKKYPPKYVISLANKCANRVELEPALFNGGEETNGFLIGLGFEIAARAGLVKLNRPQPHKAPTNPEIAVGPPDLTKRASLIALLGDIPMDTWDRIVLDEPDWKMMEPFLASYGFGRFSVLMMLLGLNDYQNKGRAEVGFWPPLKRLLEGSVVPETPACLGRILTVFFQKERLADRKLVRQERFLAGDLTREMWSCTPAWAAEHFLESWDRLANLMRQDRKAKTIVFSMKCLGIALMQAGNRRFEFGAIPIPVDSRVVRLTGQLGYPTDDADLIREYWSTVLQDLAKKQPSINMIHLDSLVWQVATEDAGHLRELFDGWEMPSIGARLDALRDF